jgi:AraC family transcriptional regulator
MLNQANQGTTYFSKGSFLGSKKHELSVGPVSISETTYNEGLCSDWHYHENLRYSYIVNGGNIEKGRGWQQEHLTGGLVFYYPGLEHKNENYLASTRVFNIEIDNDFFSQYEVYNSVPLNIDPYNELQCKILMFKIFRERYIADEYSALSINELCLALTQSSQQHKQYRQAPAWVKNIYSLLHDNRNSHFTLYELSCLLQVHPVTISKNFSRYFGCTLGEYIRRIKVSRAVSLLANPKYSLTEIAYECGFVDQSHFTKTFLHITRALPKAYRKQMLSA